MRFSFHHNNGIIFDIKKDIRKIPVRLKVVKVQHISQNEKDCSIRLFIFSNPDLSSDENKRKTKNQKNNLKT